MLTRLVLGRAPILTASLARNAYKQMPFRQNIRHYARDNRTESFAQRSGRMTLKEKAMAPAGPKAFALGKGALAGGAAVGLGALCFYGAGLGKGTSALQNSLIWPEYVKTRIQSTYFYFAGSIVLSAAAAVAVFRTPVLLNLVAANGWMSILGTFAVMIGSGMVTRGIQYREGFGTKQLAWMVHCGILGAVIAPICFLGGPIITRAALYTAGIVGGLSTVAVCAPSDKFLYMTGPLAIGLGFVFASSMASMFLSPATALGASIYSMSLYGGLLLFSGFMLYDTQRIIRYAETYPTYAPVPYDPINAAMAIYLDTLNIFIRIASILAGGGNSRNK